MEPSPIDMYSSNLETLGSEESVLISEVSWFNVHKQGVWDTFLIGVSSFQGVLNEILL